MRNGELECVHGVGHSVNTHGCDGCCNALVVEAKAQAWEEGYGMGFYELKSMPYGNGTLQNPYRGETSG